MDFTISVSGTNQANRVIEGSDYRFGREEKRVLISIQRDTIVSFKQQMTKVSKTTGFPVFGLCRAGLKDEFLVGGSFAC